MPVQGSPWVTEQDGWICLKSMMDSGCVDFVMPPNLLPDKPIRDSAGSRRGQHYTVANGRELPNMGERELDVVTDGGGTLQVTYQVAEVTRPLASVSEI